jgi:hypothetical protein
MVFSLDERTNDRNAPRPCRFGDLLRVKDMQIRLSAVRVLRPSRSLIDPIKIPSEQLGSLAFALTDSRPNGNSRVLRGRILVASDRTMLFPAPYRVRQQLLNLLRSTSKFSSKKARGLATTRIDFPVSPSVASYFYLLIPLSLPSGHA